MSARALGGPKLRGVDVSIHDVMPQTLDRVEHLASRVPAVVGGTLLVVPGPSWSERELSRLRNLEDAGWELAGHGWLHRAEPPRSFSAHVHRAVISRGVAEHLDRDESEIAELIARNAAWFVESGLRAPTLYVPPAWAMGRISRARLRELPFERYEFLTGVYIAREDRFERQPLVGFEADAAWRALVLRGANLASRALHGVSGRTLRVAIHPFDAELRLRRALEATLAGLGPARGTPGRSAASPA